MQESSKNNERIAALKKGDPKALHGYFQEYYHVLMFFAIKLIQHRHDADYIVGGTFIKLWERRQFFDDDSSVKAFLYITVRNDCFNYLKHQQVKRNSHSELRYLESTDTDDWRDIIEHRVTEAEILKQILGEIKRLPPKMRTIFVMVFMHGLSTAEISKKLKVSTATIRVQKARAIKALKAILGENRTLTG